MNKEEKVKWGFRLTIVLVTFPLWIALIGVFIMSCKDIGLLKTILSFCIAIGAVLILLLLCKWATNLIMAYWDE